MRLFVSTKFQFWNRTFVVESTIVPKTKVLNVSLRSVEFEHGSAILLYDIKLEVYLLEFIQFTSLEDRHGKFKSTIFFSKLSLGI